MAQTLLAILLATSSAKDQTIAFRWPSSPHSSPRLARPRPPSQLNLTHVDAPYRAATLLDANLKEQENFSASASGDDFEFEWQRPSMTRRFRSHSFASSRRSSSGGRRSPVTQRSEHASFSYPDNTSEYDSVLGYNIDLLAHFLCPTKNNCHQKFELIVDDLVFIGHPVCVDESGKWSFRKEGNGFPQYPHSNKDDPISATEVDISEESVLRLFHIVFILDLPDPSSSACGNINKYFDTIYQTVVFSLTAVLFNEQVLHNYVEQQWDILVKVREDCISNGDSYDSYVEQCLRQSSLAQGLQRTYTSIYSNSLAPLTFNNITVDLQLPPFLDILLRTDQSTSYGLYPPENESSYMDEDEQRDRQYATWGPELSFGWKLPTLAPWKALLLLDVDPSDLSPRTDPLLSLNREDLRPQEREIAEELSKFLDSASVFVSLNDMATLLDWDLEEKVYPTVRYLVQRRRAKVVDTVRLGLKSIFTLPAHIDTRISELTSQFAEAFPTLPPLPVIFSRLSGSSSPFYEAVVRSKDLIPIYRNVVIWLLKRDLLVMPQMRFRLIATPTLKRLVADRRRAMRESRERRQILQNHWYDGRRRKSNTEHDRSLSRSILHSTLSEHGTEEAVEDESGDELPSLMLKQSLQSSPVRHREMVTRGSFLSTQSQKKRNGRSGLAVPPLSGDHRYRRYSDMSPASRIRPGPFSLGSEELENFEEEIESESESDPEDRDDLWIASIIFDPERATPKERRWLRGMTFGKDSVIIKQFENICKYFDGKTAVDEILYRAEISRKDFREVFRQFKDHTLVCSGRTFPTSIGPGIVIDIVGWFAGLVFIICEKLLGQGTYYDRSVVL